MLKKLNSFKINNKNTEIISDQIIKKKLINLIQNVNDVPLVVTEVTVVVQVVSTVVRVVRVVLVGLILVRVAQVALAASITITLANMFLTTVAITSECTFFYLLKD